MGRGLRDPAAAEPAAAPGSRRRPEAAHLLRFSPGSPTVCPNLSLTGRTAMARLTVNGKTLDVNVDPSTPLLWALREQMGLTGTKYGCGVAQCGACTVHLDGAAVRSCVMPVAAAEGKQVTTIEGLATGGVLHK